VQVELLERLGLPSPLRDPIARLVATFKRIAKRVRLLWRRTQLEVDDQFHRFKYRGNQMSSQKALFRGALPLPPEIGSLRAHFL
jgi:hypothetical protein